MRRGQGIAYSTQTYIEAYLKIFNGKVTKIIFSMQFCVLTKNKLNLSKRTKRFEVKNLYLKLFFAINLLRKNVKNFFLSLKLPQLGL